MTNSIKMIKRFDYSASGAFNAAVSEALSKAVPGQPIQLDCIHMDYIDSAGIGLLVMAYKKAMSHNTGITIVHAKPAIKEILLLANLQKLISIQ